MWDESRQNNVTTIMERPNRGTEVVVMDDRVMEAANHAQPPVANLSVTKSSRVHIGPKFVSVTQNVDNTGVVKGRMLCLELVSPQSAKGFRCSIAVFVCWALVVASTLAFLIFYWAFAKQAMRLDLGITEPWYLKRGQWQAMREYGIDLLDLPVPNVYIGHSATDYCLNPYECIRNVLAIQKDHLGLGWQDIGPNFLVGGNGDIFEGRGANILGAMVEGYNKFGINIMFIGSYEKDQPTDEQFNNVNKLIQILVEKGVLTPNYTVLGHCQVKKSMLSPGPHLMANMGHFNPHWNPLNNETCLKS